jgi:hypothetical protein
MMKKVTIGVMLCLSFWFSSCANSSTQSRIPTTSTAPLETQDLPAPDQVDDTSTSAYPPPASNTTSSTAYPGAPTPIITIEVLSDDPSLIPAKPQPSPGKGAIVGRLINNATNGPGHSVRVYLGVKVVAEPGPAYFISTQRNSSPQGDTTPQGYFTINDVEPGTYALVVWSPQASQVLTDPETNQDYFVDIVADEVLEIGNLYFTLQ